MLNKDIQRELAYVVHIDDIIPIEGADRVEQAVVGGWRIMVRKNQFKIGDGAIYFEIDSKVPPTEAFEFLAAKHYKIKTQKYFKGTVISQGLLMSAEDFGWEFCGEDPVMGVCIKDSDGDYHYENDESRFLTQKLNVKYAAAEDNQRKSNNLNPYGKMVQRHQKLLKKQPFKWLTTTLWGRKLLFVFLGKKQDKRGWPDWVKKTDEERIENMPWILACKEPWIATEKIDGTSTTFTMKRGRFGKYEFYVCSRNVCFDKPDKQCYYGTNVYLEMAEKYNIAAHMKDMLGNHPEWDWVTIQGETYGVGIQKNTYSKTQHSFRAFNLITSDKGRWDTINMRRFLTEGYSIPCVPILSPYYILPDTVEELREYVHSQPSVVDLSSAPQLKEGIVFRSFDGSKSFKCVDPEYLIKYHA